MKEFYVLRGDTGYAYLPCITFNEVSNQQGSFRYWQAKAEFETFLQFWSRKHRCLFMAPSQKIWKKKQNTYFMEKKIWEGGKKERQSRAWEQEPLTICNNWLEKARPLHSLWVTGYRPLIQ